MTQTLARSLSLGLVLVVVMVSTVEARSRRVKKPPSDSRVVALLQRVIADNESLRRELVEIKQRLRPDAVASIEPTPEPTPSANPAAVAPMPIPDHSKTLRGYEQHIARSAKLKDLTPKLADKVSEILVSCPGAILTSGYRRGARVARSGWPSLHSRYPSEAADLAGNYRCIYSKLKRWPGGYSIDPMAVRHIHLSMAHDKRERGSRFAHHGTRHARKVRYAQ